VSFIGKGRTLADEKAPPRFPHALRAADPAGLYRTTEIPPKGGIFVAFARVFCYH